MAKKPERFQMSFTEEQLHWLRQYMVDNAVNNVQDAVRHVIDRCIADQWDLSQPHRQFLREYMASQGLDSIPDAVRHIVDRKINVAQPAPVSAKKKTSKKNG